MEYKLTWKQKPLGSTTQFFHIGYASTLTVCIIFYTRDRALRNTVRFQTGLHFWQGASSPMSNSPGDSQRPPPRKTVMIQYAGFHSSVVWRVFNRFSLENLILHLCLVIDN